jgi:hypothetical protein
MRTSQSKPGRESAPDVIAVQLLRPRVQIPTALLAHGQPKCQPKCQPKGWGDPTVATSVHHGYEWAPHDWVFNGDWRCRRCRVLGEECGDGRVCIEQPIPLSCPLDLSFWDVQRKGEDGALRGEV